MQTGQTRDRLSYLLVDGEPGVLTPPPSTSPSSTPTLTLCNRGGGGGGGGRQSLRDGQNEASLTHMKGMVWGSTGGLQEDSNQITSTQHGRLCVSYPPSVGAICSAAWARGSWVVCTAICTYCRRGSAGEERRKGGWKFSKQHVWCCTNPHCPAELQSTGYLKEMLQQSPHPKCTPEQRQGQELQ